MKVSSCLHAAPDLHAALRHAVDSALPSSPDGLPKCLSLPGTSAPILFIDRGQTDEDKIVPAFFITARNRDLLELASEVSQLSTHRPVLTHVLGDPAHGRFVVIPFLFDRCDNPAEFIEAFENALCQLAFAHELSWFTENCAIALASNGVLAFPEVVGDKLRARHVPLGQKVA